MAFRSRGALNARSPVTPGRHDETSRDGRGLPVDSKRDGNMVNDSLSSHARYGCKYLVKEAISAAKRGYACRSELGKGCA